MMEEPINNEEQLNDSSDEEYIIKKTKSIKKVKKIKKDVACSLKMYHDDNPNIVEIGVDEAGRGPLFGRVYTAAVILPKNNAFNFSKVKDSKKFHSKKKIEEACEYIKKNALAWHVSYEDEKIIDDINILQATQQSMHTSINEVCKKYNKLMIEID
jgi:ribonuclease HII